MVAIIQAWRPGCKVAQALFVWRACVCCLLADADVFVRVSAAQLCREHPYDMANQPRAVWAAGWASMPPTQSALSHGRRALLLPLVACALASRLGDVLGRLRKFRRVAIVCGVMASSSHGREVCWVACGRPYAHRFRQA